MRERIVLDIGPRYESQPSLCYVYCRIRRIEWLSDVVISLLPFFLQIDESFRNNRQSKTKALFLVGGLGIPGTTNLFQNCVRRILHPPMVKRTRQPRVMVGMFPIDDRVADQKVSV